MPKSCTQSSSSTRTSKKADVGEGTESEVDLVNSSKLRIKSGEIPYLWYPTLQSVKQIEYVRKLEGEFACLQKAFLAMTTHYARVQFRLRQITLAAPCERDKLLIELEKMAFDCAEADGNDELPRIQRDLRCMGDVRRKQNFMLEKLRNQLTALTEASELEGIEAPLPESDSSESGRRSCCSGSKRSASTKTSASSAYTQ